MMALPSRQTLAARMSGGASGSARRGSPGLNTAQPLEPASGGSVVLNEEWDITEMDAEARRLLRCPLPEVVGLDFWDAVPESVAEQHQGTTLHAMFTLQRHAFVVHDPFEDNWIQYTFRRRLTAYVITVRDVGSSQKLQRLLDESDRYNQLLFEANPNAMWIFDATSLHILAVNQAAVQFYGVERHRFLTLSMGALFPDGAGAALLSALDASAGNGSGNRGLDAQLCKQQKADGQLVLVELASSYINWNGWRAVMVSLADVADRHLADRNLRRINAAMEQELAKVQLDLKNANRDLSAFTYALSNDLQAPLHAVNGFASMLSDKYSAVLDQSGRHFVERIQASTRQLAKLVDDLRTLAQLPVLSGELETIDLAPLCGRLIDGLRKRDPDRTVTLEMADCLPLMGDKNLLVTALVCLLENAWKFTSRKPEAWIRVGLLPGAVPDELVLMVSDNGSGFDKAYIGKLFTPFQRLHSSAEFPGHGLGLSIVKRVALRHGGRVWAETGDFGASFFMALPQRGAVDGQPGPA